MSIALDAMGGDHAPAAILQGAIWAAPQLNRKLFVVGDQARLEAMLTTPLPSNIEIVHAPQTVEMHEKPTEAYRLKKNSSIAVCANLVQQGAAEALVSAGNTGAVSTFSLLTWRQIPGIHRPAIASQIPNKHQGFVLLDAGASPDVEPEHLVEFGVMGRAFAEKVMGRTNPRVHLLNIGEEEGKGNAFAKEAHSLLKKHAWFAGNIEGKEMYHSRCDVVVCDAFVGNVVLKTSEGVAELIADALRASVPKNALAKLSCWPMLTRLRPLKQMLDYAEFGGAPLLGLNGLCVICHGRSNSKAIKNALLSAQVAIENGLVDTIRKTIASDV